MIGNGSGMDTELNERVFRIMDALSGVDEILLERCERKNKIIDYNSHKRTAGGKRKDFPGRGRAFGRRFSRTWAAVLCLAVVGSVSWGGYKLTQEVNNSGGNSAADSTGSLPMQSVTVAQGPESARAGEAGGAPSDGAGAWNEAEKEFNEELKEGLNAGSADSCGAANGGAVREESLPAEEREAAQEVQKEAQKGNNVLETESDGSIADKSGACVEFQYVKISTEAEARAVKNLGIYVPTTLPGGYVFESAWRSPEEESLRVNWRRGMDYIEVSIAAKGDTPATVDVDRPETYDERLYEIPYADSVPGEYRESFENPVFALEDFSPEIVESRMMSHGDAGDTDTPRGNFTVLYPDGVAVRFSGRGTAEEIWELFESIRPE